MHARQRLESRQPVRSPAEQTPRERVRAAWQRHPAVAVVRHRRRVTLLRQLHSLVKAGFGLPNAFAELSAWGPDPETARAMREVSAQVDRGSGFSEALAREREIFDETTVALLAAAEETGGLERILDRLIHQQEEMDRFRKRAMVMAIYPAYILGGLLLFGPLLGVPGAIRAGASTGKAGIGYLVGLVGGLGFAAIFFGLLFSLPMLVAALGWEERWDRLRLRLPVLGPLFRDLYGARFCLGLGTAIGAGLEIGRSLQLATLATGSRSRQDAAATAIARIHAGGSLAQAVQSLGLLDQVALGTLAVGEKTGQLDRMLERLASDLWESATRRMKLLVYATLVAIGGGAMVMILSKMLGVLFGPIWDYFHVFGGDGLP